MSDKIARMPQTQTPAQQKANPSPLIPEAVQLAAQQWGELQSLASKLQSENMQLDRALALAQNDSENWQRRALDAEQKRDFYLRYSTELLTRLANVRIGADQIVTQIDQIANEAKHASFRPGAPGRKIDEPDLDEASQQRLAELAKKLAPDNYDDDEGS
jgi:hypothetical protein